MWDRTGGSNALNDWRTDAQLVVDIEPIAGTDNVKLTARVRGLAITKEDNKGVWKRAESYWATGELKLQARDVNGSFTVVVREQTRGEIKVAGVEPAEPCTLTYTLPRAQLIDHAIDFSYHVDDATRISRATVSGRCVLNIPPSMDTYRPGTVRDPATGERSGDKTTANTPIQHKLHGYAKLTTADAGNGADTNITANVHISVTGMLGAPELLTKVSVLERYDAQKDAWVSVASRSTRKTKGMTSSSVDADTLTARVAGKIAPLWNTSS
ncbi:hypothetical protein DEJ50_00530 [Streptomyces venezuelae]|uniref:Uncharacterized protein n=1 Tax=Streptomyces venezuelae TaxID=54571 RepID=A0A5P2CUF2_STRVZ|nr:hypothetical protein [Streptomyces venezuelae]QES46562.1 hypothetical protein DEJ50_00530 [Streptomyces venezuelae]